MGLLDDDRLERSSVVANRWMNRERGLPGYDRELGFNPIDLLRGRIASGCAAAWLDLCFGSGKALIEAATILPAGGLDVEIVSVDLDGMFRSPDPGLTCLRLVEASLTAWQPDGSFDPIVCVHDLHYVGDKLRLIARAARWLIDDGLFVADLDLANLKLADGRGAGRKVSLDLLRAGLEYDRRRRLVVCRGRRVVDLPYRYRGADDRAGPDYTGQPAVDSYYEPIALDPARTR